MTGEVSQAGQWTSGCESVTRSGSRAKFYNFTLNQREEVAITLESDDADTYLYLRGAERTGLVTTGLLIDENDDHEDNTARSQIRITLDPGIYIVEATTYNRGETGSFTVMVGEPDSPTPTVGEPDSPTPTEANCVDTVTVGDTITGQWTPGCESDEQSGSYARFYNFTLALSTEVIITLESDDTDTYLYLLSGSGTSGTVLHENDNHEGSTSRSQIQETLAAGTYTIEATTYDPGITGSFTLTISGLEATTQPPTTPEVVCFQDLGVLIETTTVAEAWTGECPSPHWYGRYARHYTFTLLRELELRVGLISTEDAFLFLLHGADPDGALVAGNDDVSSGNTNSYIARTLAAGTYTIEATTRDQGIIGNFTLTIDPRDIPTIPLPPRPTPPSPSEAFDRNAAGDFANLAGTRIGNDYPVGIWSDWATVWVADRADAKLYAYDMTSKARVAGKDFDTLAAAGNNHLAGIWSDSDTMWVVDYSDARVYAYHAESKARHIAEEFGGLSSAGNANPTGIWSDGATMWVADSVDKKIYAYNMRTKAAVPEKDINTLNAAGNHHPQGLWSNGKTMWVADDSDDKVYAYDLTTKAQMPGKDFETLKAAGNNNPSGIWSNGATMLVSDHGVDRLFAYNMPPNLPPNLPVTPPGMPAIGSVSPGASSLTVSWSAPSGDPGGITAYDLRHIRTDADETVDANWTMKDDAWTTGSGALQYVLTGLDGGAQYDVQVRAVSSAGYGPWSTTVTGTPETTGPPPTSGASRTFSSVSVDPADELTVTITAPGSFTGQVVETLPPGFIYVASSLSDSAVAVEGQIVTFTLLGDASFTYTVTASSVEGVYSFDGVLTPFGGEELPIGGDSTVTVGSAPMVYLSLDDSLPLMVRIGSPLPVIATFTEAVSDFTVDDITVLNGTVGNFLADAEGIVYTFDVTPDAVAKVTVDIATSVAMDSEGNGNTAAAQLSFTPYDDDGVAGISKAEAIAAIRDYFSGKLDKAQAIAVIRLYFASGG